MITVRSTRQEALIMDEMGVPPERRAAFWNQYKMVMLDGVNQQRQKTQTSIGAKWKGKTS
jgi:hypothetical protein